MKTQHLAARTLVAVIAVGVTISCGRDEPEVDQNPPAETAPVLVNGINVSMNTLSCNDVVESGNIDPATFLLRRAHVVEGAFGQRLVSIANEPHDCQPLIVDARDTLTAGPLVTVWAFENMRTVETRDVPVPVAGIVVEGVNVDPAALNLPALRSCMWVLPNTNAAWRAWVVPASDRGCGDVPVDSIQALPAAREFGVSRLSQTGVVGNRMIGARIIEMPGRQYRIGFQCGDRWCVTMAPEGVIDPSNSIRIVSAFGDWQRLHKYVNGKLQKTTLDSRIVPDPQLIKMTKMKHWEGDFHMVGRIEFDLDNAAPEDIEYYENKLGISPLTRTVTIEMVHEATKPWASFWQIRYNGSVVKPGHWMGSNDLPGQARWKTHLKDEGVWVSCVFGCCGDQ